MVFRCVRISIRGLVRRSIGWLVGPFIMLLSKLMKNGLLRILNDLDSAGPAGRGRKEGRGGRRDEEEGGTGRVKK